MRRGLKILFLPLLFLCFFISAAASDSAETVISMQDGGGTNIKWISLPYGKFEKASELADYINKGNEKKKIISIMKWIPEKGAAIRYSYKETMSSWAGINFEIMPWEAVGIQHTEALTGFDPAENTGKSIIFKGDKKEITYAVSVPYGKYKTLSDIIKNIEDDMEKAEKLSKIKVWSEAENDFNGLEYDDEKKEWAGNNKEITGMKAVFITLKKGVADISWTP
ncbi:MAG: hypothetical protein ACOC4H_02720 [bacterium]